MTCAFPNQKIEVIKLEEHMTFVIRVLTVAFWFKTVLPLECVFMGIKGCHELTFAYSW